MNQQQMLEMGFFIPFWLEGCAIQIVDGKKFIVKDEVVFDAEQFLLPNVREYLSRKYREHNAPARPRDPEGE